MQGRLPKIKVLIMVAWLSLLGGFSYWFEMNTRRDEHQKALLTAKAIFQQILVSRKWNALHGGVYVPITNATPPNEYLTGPNRDLTADNGIALTKVNPAYMTRQMAELSQENINGIQFHLTSLKPIRPENRAMAWEEPWLRSFEQGVSEQGEFFHDGERSWFRYMAPLRVDRECLQCHAQHDFKLGEIRGGLSVSVPYASHGHLQLIVGYGSVAFIGLLFILIGMALYERKQRLFDATFNSPVPTSVTNTSHHILMANEAYWAKFGPLPPGHKSIKCHEHRPGASCHTPQCPLTRIVNGAETYTYESIKEREGASRHFIITAKPLLDASGTVIGCVESFQEITERKQAEEALQESNRKLEALSNTDGLTGIANRRLFDETLAREYARHARSGAPLSLILLDIDYFKSFNDCYGHVKGDECLQQVAQAMNGCVTRPPDLVARYGGEEFACILPETDGRGATVIAEKIRRDILALAIPHQGSNIAEWVTASLGVVTERCTPDGSALDLVTTVDAQLYRAKSAGRNQVAAVAPAVAKEAVHARLVQLTWHGSFCCGHPVLDSQHQSLFLLANELLKAVLSDRPITEIEPIITRLLDEVSQHFRDEESIIEEAGFAGIGRHLEEHAKLLARGLELSLAFKASTVTIGDIFQFLAYDMVQRHMLESDREFFPLLQGKSWDAPPMPPQEAL
ncbi:MAG: diguanylate cyclase domain-containing protein [Thermodesulfobacteriota bacterium]